MFRRCMNKILLSLICLPAIALCVEQRDMPKQADITGKSYTTFKIGEQWGSKYYFVTLHEQMIEDGQMIGREQSVGISDYEMRQLKKLQQCYQQACDNQEDINKCAVCASKNILALYQRIAKNLFQFLSC